MKIEHHRNGITGEPFAVSIKKMESGRRMLIIQFRSDPTRTAVLDLDLAHKGVIDSLMNGWRGDSFQDEMHLAILSHDTKVNELAKKD